MPLWECDFEKCDSPAVRELGDCVLCDQHLCARHLQLQLHSCPRWQAAEDYYSPAFRQAEESEITQLIKKINITALEARATSLRQGLKCSIAPLHYDRSAERSVMGGMNYHVEIPFEDGVVWLARIRRFNATSPPPSLRDYIVQSEVATLQFLENTAVPAPKIYDYAVDQPENPVGIGFILMKKLPGKALRWSLLNRQQRRKIVDQVADILIDLQKHPFNELGSLSNLGHRHVGPFAREALTNFLQSEMNTIGPLHSVKDYHESLIKLQIKLIIQEEAHTERAVDAYLIMRFLLDLIPLVVSQSLNDGNFYLKHADDKGDHILVNDDLEITGIIDWEWAHTAPPSQAFNSPMAFWSLADFYDGKNCLGEDEIALAHSFEEKGHKDLAQIVRDGRLMNRFTFCCLYDLSDWDGFLGLFLGLRDASGVDKEMDWSEWKAGALDRYKDDSDLRLLLSRQSRRE